MAGDSKSDHFPPRQLHVTYKKGNLSHINYTLIHV